MRRRGLLLAPGLLALAGCTGGGTAAGAHASPSQYFNDADVAFVRDLIAANTRSARIARCAHGRSLPSALRSLAAAVASTERDENKTMAAWLRTWRPGASPDAARRHDDDVRRLRDASDDDFGGLFRHALAGAQRGQLTIAATETRHGINVGARHLAARVTSSRSAELRQLDD